MQRILSLGVYAPIRYIIIIAALVLPACQNIYGQKPVNKVFQQSNYVKRVSWNILFGNNTDFTDRKQAIQNVKDSLVRYYNYNYHDTIPVFDSALYCPCDSLLYNLNMRFVDGSGGSVSSPPPAKPGPDGSGDYVAIQYISNNNPILEMEPNEKPPARLNMSRIPLIFSGVNDTNVLAIIDTGIDTAVFSSNVKKLLWKSTTQEATMYNFLPRQNLYNFKDDHKSRHGTVVTAIALKALSTGGTGTQYPKIMILKALDSNKRGSIFSVSCALSYACKNKATVVNASLGYYGNSDPVLLHYIKRCNSNTSKPILIFAAAGNMSGERNVDLCHSPRSENQLTTIRTFFPASWSPQLKHVITITGLNILGRSCYYQNYSKKFVTLGVSNRRSGQGRMQGGCCSYKVPFSNKYYEGSSFATPVACGMLMRYMLNNRISTKQLIYELAFPGDGPTGNIIHQGTPAVTVDGKYLVFPVNP